MSDKQCKGMIEWMSHYILKRLLEFYFDSQVFIKTANNNFPDYYSILIFCYFFFSTRSPKLRSRSSSLSMSSSFNSLSDDSNTAITPSTVDTLQIMRFEPPPVDLEEEPTYGPAVRERERGGGREREGREGERQ